MPPDELAIQAEQLRRSEEGGRTPNLDTSSVESILSGQPLTPPANAAENSVVGQNLEPGLLGPATVSVDGIDFNIGIPRAGEGTTTPDNSINTRLRYGQKQQQKLDDQRRLDLVASDMEQLVKANVYPQADLQKGFLLALKNGLMPSDVMPDLEKLEKELAGKGMPYNIMAERYPAVTQMIMEGPVQAQLLGLQIKPLSFIEEYFTGRRYPNGELEVESRLGADAGERLVKRHWRSFAGSVGAIFDSEWGYETADRLKAEERMPLQDPSAVVSALEGAANAAGFLGVTYAGSAAGAGSGAAIGAGVGALAGPGGVAAGAKIGAVVGGFLGGQFINAVTMAGDIQERLDQIDGLDPATARVIATLSAFGAGGIAELGGGVLLKGAGGASDRLLKKIGLDAADQLVGRLENEGALAALAARYPGLSGFARTELHAAATMASMSGFNALTYELTRSGVQGGAPDFGAVAKESMQGALVAMRDFLAFSAYKGFHAHAVDMGKAREALENAEGLIRLVSGVEELAKNADAKPGFIKEVVNEIGRKAGSDKETVLVDREAIERAAAAEKKSPADWVASTFEDGKQLWDESGKSGFLAVNAGEFAEKIVAKGRTREFATDIKWKEDGWTVREAGREAAKLQPEIIRQKTEERTVQMPDGTTRKGAPVKMVAADIEWALKQTGTKPAIAKALGDTFGHYFAVLAAKGGKSRDPDYDAYGLWLRNPLFFKLAGAPGDGAHVLLNPYMRSQMTSPGPLGVLQPPETTPGKVRAPKEVQRYYAGVNAGEGVTLGFHTVGGMRDTSPVGVWGPKGMVVVEIGEPRTMGHAELVKLQAGQPVEGYLLVPARDALAALRAGKLEGRVFLADMLLDKESLKASARGARWADAKEAKAEVTASAMRETRAKRVPHAGAYGTLAHVWEIDKTTGAAYATDNVLAIHAGGGALISDFHELTHYAVNVLHNVVVSMGKEASPELGRSSRELFAWAGYPAVDAAGKPLTAFQMTQLRALSNMAAREGAPLTPDELYAHAPLAPRILSDAGGLDVAGLAVAAVRAEEKIAHAFTAYMKTGKPPTAALSEAFGRMADYARGYFDREQRELGPDVAGWERYERRYRDSVGAASEVEQAMRHFFAAEDALIGVGADQRMEASRVMPGSAGEAPERAEPYVAGSWGRGNSEVDASKLTFTERRDEKAPPAGAKPKEEERPKGTLTPKQVHDLSMKMSPAARDAARAELIKKLKDAADSLKGKGTAEKGQRKLTAEIGRERETIADAVRQEIGKDPVAHLMVAMGGRLSHLAPEQQARVKAYLDQGIQFRLDYDAIRSEYGKATADSLPDYLYARGRREKRTSVSLGEATAIMGLDEAGFLKRAAELKSFKDHVKNETDLRLIQKYGEILWNPDMLAAEALQQAFNNDKAIQKTISDMHALRDAIAADRLRTQDLPELLDPGAIRALALQAVSGDTMVSRIQPDVVARQQDREWQRAFEAAVGGDLRKAYEHKAQQLWLHTLWLASVDRRAQLDSLRMDLEGRQAKRPHREALGKADPVLREVHDGLLELVGLRTVPKGEQAMAPTLLAKMGQVVDYARSKAQVLMFAPEEITQLAQDVATRIPAAKAGSKWAIWNYLTVDQAELVDRVTRQLTRMAKEEKEYRRAGELMEIQDMTAQVKADAIRQHLPELTSGHYRLLEGTATPSQRIGRAFQAIDGGLSEAETIMGTVSESLRDSVMTEFRDARGRRDRLAANVLSWWNQNWMKGRPLEVRRRMRETVDLAAYGLDIASKPGKDPEPIDTKFNRLGVMMIALHMGNPENEFRLLQGYGWEKKNVLKMIGQELTADELKFIQSTWDFFNKNLWPLVKEKTERQSGLPLRAVEAAPVEIPLADGSVTTLAGGYFPARYSRDLATRFGSRSAWESDLGQYFKSNYSRQTPWTYKGHTKGRVDQFYDRLQLDFGILSGHLVQVVHDIAFDDFVKNTGKLFSDKDFSDTLVRYAGKERMTNLNDWLWGVANGYVDTVPEALKRVHSIFQGFKDHTIIGILGHNLGVAAGDLTNIPVVIASGRIQATTAAMVTKDVLAAKATGNLERWYEDLCKKSSVVNTRSNHWVLQIRQQMNEDARAEGLVGRALDTVIPGKAGEAAAYGYERATDAVKRSAFILQEKIDKYSSIVIWESAFREAEGMPEGERVKYADRILDESLPHLEKMTQPTFLRNPWVGSSILLFHGYFNKLGNMLRQDFHEKVYEPYRAARAGEPGAAGALAWGASKFAMETLAIFFLSNVAAEWMAGRGQDRRETMWQYLSRKMIAAPFALVPFGAPVGEAVGAKLAGSRAGTGNQGTGLISFRQAPQLALWESLGRLTAEAFDGRRTMDKRLWSGLEAALYAQGLPARQWRRSGQYLQQTLSGDRGVQDPFQFGSGMMYGERTLQPSNPFQWAHNRVQEE